MRKSPLIPKQRTKKSTFSEKTLEKVHFLPKIAQKSPLNPKQRTKKSTFSQKTHPKSKSGYRPGSHCTLCCVCKKGLTHSFPVTTPAMRRPLNLQASLLQLKVKKTFTGEKVRLMTSFLHLMISNIQVTLTSFCTNELHYSTL